MDEKIDLKAIFLKILSKWYYFLISALILFPLAYAYVEMAPKKYKVRASILIKSEQTNGVGTEQFLKGMELFTTQTELEDEIGIIQSYENVRNAINSLNFSVSYFGEKNFMPNELYGDAPFVVELDSSVNQVTDLKVYIERVSKSKFMVTASGQDVGTYNFLTNEPTKELLPIFEVQEVVDITKPFVNKNLGFKISFNDNYKGDFSRYYFKINNLDALAEDFQSKVELQPISRESNLVELTMKESVPQKGIDFLNRLLEVYLENELYKKNQLGLKTIQFIDNQLSGVSDSLKRVEGSLESYRSKNNILDIETKAQNLTENLDRLEQDQSEVKVKLQYYSYILTSLEKEGSVNDMIAPSSFGVVDPVLSNLLIELSKLNQERSGLNVSAREGNPLSEVLDLKIKNIKKLIKENVTNIIDATNIALNDLDRRIAQINAQLSRLPRNERELVKIQRRFDFSDNVYNYLLEKRAEAGIAIASNVVDKTIIDRAMQVGSEPFWPSKKIVFGLAFVLSCIGALGVIIVKDFFNDSIVTHEDLERNTKLPFLGVINHGSKREKDNVVANAMSPVGESFRTLRVNLQYLTFGKEINVIGFTSSRESEGKTFCAVNLAASMAHSRRRTVLIDTDMRRPRVASYFQLENDKGLSSYLIGECSAREIINETGIKGFDVIASGPIPPNPLDLLGQTRFEELIAELKKTYNTIIIDAPPIGYVSEYVILMKYTDANIYVVRSEYTTRFNLEKINKLYDERKISNFSVLLNDVRYSRLNGYTYNYKYKTKKYKKVF